MEIPNLPGVEELAFRQSGGVDVFLLWHKKFNTLSILMNDHNSDVAQMFPVPNSEGMRAFEHPFIYQPIAETSNAVGS